MGKYKKLSVVIPCYKESGTIDDTIKQVESYLKKKKYDYRIICVNDGSPDDTAKVIRKIAKKKKKVYLAHYKENHGKGYAVKRGVLYSRKKWPKNDVLFMDADLSTPIEMIERVDTEKRDVVSIGDRNHPESVLSPPQGFMRKVAMGYTYKLFVNIILGFDLRDTQCGFKYFPHETTHIFEKQTIEGFSFDTELLFIAQKEGYGVEPIPITWENDPDSRVNVLRDPPKMLLGLVKTRFNGLRGKYES